MKREDLVTLVFTTVVRRERADDVTKELFSLCGGDGLSVNDIGVEQRELTDDDWKDTCLQLDLQGEMASINAIG